MPKEYLVLIGAVFGGGITILVTIINLYFNNKKQKSEFKRDKIEDIHLLIHQLQDYLEAGIQNPNSSFPPRMEAGTRQEEAKLKAVFKNGFYVKKQRLEMYVNFYCDNLLTQADDYIKESENFLKKSLEARYAEDIEELGRLEETLREKRDFLLKSVYAEAIKNY
ncbi:hypothetical protein [Priestia sp. YIM B13489]|uniref:hypothetical protein n=1 Tax=Priestia sp. YIM B13489 TaxID=3366313 RepID=UPI00367088F6